MSEDRIPKEKTLEEKMAELHPKFLETIREVYQLAVLSSLCIAVTAFTQQSYPQVQPYSITAASLFLIAFISSFTFKVMSDEKVNNLGSFAFISYLATATAVVMLFLVVLEFGKSFSFTGKIMLLILMVLFFLFIMLSTAISFGKAALKEKSRFARFCFGIGTTLLILFLILFGLTSVSLFFDYNVIPNRLFENVGIPSLVLSLIFILIGLPSALKEAKNKKTSNLKIENK